MGTQTAAQLLAIPLDSPERLYNGDVHAIDVQFRRLAAVWHPDYNKEVIAAKVFAHVNVLRENAKKKIADGTFGWRPFELGKFSLTPQSIVFSLDQKSRDLGDHALKLVKSLKFADDKMRKEHERYLPMVRDVTTKTSIVFRKDSELILLSDLQKHLGGRLDAKHVAWILSTLYALNCYLNYSGVVHNAINVDTYYINPTLHSGALLGGWWYAQTAGQPLKALPATTLAELPDLKKTPVAQRQTDSALIRTLGRQLLGGPTGVPDPLWRWLIGPGRAHAYTEYSEWQKTILPASFGARRYVKLEVKASDIYGR